MTLKPNRHAEIMAQLRRVLGKDDNEPFQNRFNELSFAKAKGLCCRTIDRKMTTQQKLALKKKLFELRDEIKCGHVEKIPSSKDVENDENKPYQPQKHDESTTDSIKMVADMDSFTAISMLEANPALFNKIFKYLNH